MNKTISLNFNMQEVIDQVGELQQIIQHFTSIPILIRGIQEYCPEPQRSEILAKWDEARTTKGGTNE